jgi:hypothetical protein
MIKRISHIILALVIFVVTTGMTISSHYCGESLKDMSVLIEADSCCEVPDGCCHDETVTIKIEDSFSISSYSFDFSEIVLELSAIIELMNFEVQSITEIYFLNHLRPPLKIQTILSCLQTYRL